MRGQLPAESAGLAGGVLIYDDGNAGTEWLRELVAHGFPTTATVLGSEARRLLASRRFGIAVIGGNPASWLPAQQWRAYRTPLIFASPRVSAEIVLDLSKDAALVLPGPLEPGVLARAIALVARTDRVKNFSIEHKLSRRETALLRLALSGMNNDEAAATLTCSRATIATFWNRIFRKTGVSGQRDVFILLLQEQGDLRSIAM